MVFEKAWEQQAWQFKGKPIQQVKTFKYLGLTFHYKLCWVQHCILVVKSSKLLAQSVLRFFVVRGNSCIPATLRIFNAKIISHLLYGIQLWLPAFNYEVERIHSVSFYKIFGVAHCISTQLYAWRQAKLDLSFWHGSDFINSGFPSVLKLRPCSLVLFFSLGLPLFYPRIWSIGLSVNLLGTGTLNNASKILTLRLTDIERQNLFAAASRICSLLHLQLPIIFGQSPS